MAKRTIVIGEGEYTGHDNTVIQKAVDTLAYEQGGVVQIPAGTFVMRDALYLRTRVSIDGAGRETVLLKEPSVSSPIADYLGYGHYELTVNPSSAVWGKMTDFSSFLGRF